MCYKDKNEEWIRIWLDYENSRDVMTCSIVSRNISRIIFEFMLTESLYRPMSHNPLQQYWMTWGPRITLTIAGVCPHRSEVVTLTGSTMHTRQDPTHCLVLLWRGPGPWHCSAECPACNCGLICRLGGMSRGRDEAIALMGVETMGHH